MSIRTTTRYFVTCETCPAEHEAVGADSTMAARVAAGVVGWKYRTTHPQKIGRRSYDYCPSCEVPR
ncbi:hypothetical protein ACGF0J_21880 [Nonomuraea sp. NPDC047897]|uniref:hypothetical protein n=1 Tax=Nonomuraea sp. NPDC047897 TaxID=3364346 RepID=UPI003724A86F